MRYMPIIAALSQQQPAAGPLAFGASPFDGWNATETSASDTIVQIAYRDQAAGAAARPRRMGVRLINTTGLSPELRIAATPAYEANQSDQIATAYHVVWKTAAAPEDEWTSLGQGAVVGSNRVFSLSDLPAGPLDFQTMPCARVAYMRAQVDAWIADALTSPTESAVTGYVIGTLAPVTWDGVAVPGFDLRAFKLGTGPRVMVLTGCVHPDEAPAWWGMEAAVGWLLGDSAAAVAFRERWTVFVYPECNLQGAWAGRTRVGITNVDMNREFDTDTEPTKVILRAAFAADLEAVDAVIDYHGTRGLGGTTYRDIWRRLAQSDSGAVSAFDDEMAARGAYTPVNTTGTAPTSINGYVPINYPADDAGLYLIYEARANRNVGPNDWRALSVDVIEAIHTIQPDIWPDAPTGDWSVTGGAGQLTISDAPEVTAPSAPTVTGGTEQLTITG